MMGFKPPKFRTHPLIRGGHLQTICSVGPSELAPSGTIAHTVDLPDGDAIVLHENRPSGWQSGGSSILLLHGLSGCHAAPYMIRLANRFLHRGHRVFRMDMRGCGAAWGLARQLSHAGRSDDVSEALSRIAEWTACGPINAIGVSLGGNQLLKAVGRIGAGKDPRPDWFARLKRIAAVVPPLDLQRCSDNMQHWTRRPYNHYFIRQLLSRVPKLVGQREDYQEFLAARRPKTLRELDDRMTAPLSGFADAIDYYRSASAKNELAANPVETLIVAAADDPIVPVDCFSNVADSLPSTTQLLISRGGGHNGFIGPGSECWIDTVMLQWFHG